MLGVSARTVQRWAARGLLPVVRLPGSNLLFFDKENIDKVFDALKK